MNLRLRWPQALATPAFRWFFVAHSIGIAGHWMQKVAAAWLVYRLSESTLMLGVAGFAQLTPILLFGLWGGVLADRWPRRRILLLAQGVVLAQALLLAALTLSGRVEVWQVLLISVVHGTAMAFEQPARMAFVAELAPRAHLTQAIALNAGVFNGARMAVPPLAGLLVALWNEGAAFALNALCFGAYLLILGLKVPVTPAAPRPTQGRRDALREGLRYAWTHPVIRHALAMIALISAVGIVYLTLLPAFAAQAMSGGSELYGLLLGATGLGSVIGAVLLARRRHDAHALRRIGISGVLGGLTQALFPLSGLVWLVLPLLALTGLLLTLTTAACNALVQHEVEERLRGRVMALVSVTFLGLTPFTGLLAGALAEHWGSAAVMSACGLLMALGAALHLRPPAPAAECKN